MLASRVLSRVSRSVGRRSLLLVSSAKEQQLPIISNQLNSLVHETPNEGFRASVVLEKTFCLHLWVFHLLQVRCLFFITQHSVHPRFIVLGSHLHRLNIKKRNKGVLQKIMVSSAEMLKLLIMWRIQGRTEVNDQTKESGFDSEPLSTMSQSIKRRRRGTKRTAFSDSDSESESESDLSREDLVKLLKEREELLKAKHKETEDIKDKVLRTYAEMENIKERNKT
ncbi:hypothetical protein Pint_04058 [Pistacia integerrima]|uniref:Uncharacterized protein n=1 Tax=Pistacia integerrima TaxID=434235 RepID=A0ACC0Z665_9ROSI|nr:hypothetical protein Pint_04058 [Pistacia integerrima]